MHEDTPTTHELRIERDGSPERPWVLRCESCSEALTISDSRRALDLATGAELREGCIGEPGVVSPYRLAELTPGTRVRLEPTTRSYSRGGVQVFEKATQPTVLGTVVHASAEAVTITPSASIYGPASLSVQSGGPTEAFTLTADELSHGADSPWHTLYGWDLPY